MLNNFNDAGVLDFIPKMIPTNNSFLTNLFQIINRIKNGQDLLNSIIDLGNYKIYRSQLLNILLSLRKKLKIYIMPQLTLNFENNFTLWMQIQEMLYIEPSSTPEDEVLAYQNLLPTSNSLSATLMISISDREQRDKMLAQWQGLEFYTFICFNLGAKLLFITGTPVKPYQEHLFTQKTSAVNFLEFNLKHQISNSNLNLLKFLDTVGVDHPRLQVLHKVDEGLFV